MNNFRYATSNTWILIWDGISAIKQQLPILPTQEKLAYLDMLSAICKLAERFPDQAEFMFEGDLD